MAKACTSWQIRVLSDGLTAWRKKCGSRSALIVALNSGGYRYVADGAGQTTVGQLATAKRGADRRLKGQG